MSTTKMNKEDLRKNLSEGLTDKVIKELNKIRPSLDETSQKDILMQSAQFEHYLRLRRDGLTSSDEQNIARARVNHALLEIIERLPQKYDAVSNPTQKEGPLSKYPYLLPISIALVVVVLMLYWVNGQSSFDVTVRLVGANADVAIKRGGTVELGHSSGYQNISFDKNGYATFKNIQSDKTTFKINIEDFTLAEPDKVYDLTKKQRVDLNVVMKKGFGTVKGKAVNQITNEILEGVRIVLTVKDSDFVARTDGRGEFKIKLPEQFTAEKYDIKADKEGYFTQTIEWISGDPREVPIMLVKQ
jgi:hypothetical protein